jgi:hypothetical protein
MKALGIALLALMGVAASASAQKAPIKTLGKRDSIPVEQRAPKGMCRIWLKDVPAAQQPAPTDCATAIKTCPPTGRVIFGDTEDSKNKPKIDTKSFVDPKQSSTTSKKPPGI